MTAWQHVPHQWITIKHIPRQICGGCGLVRLRNALTRWCERHGCDHDERPEFKAICRKLGRPERAQS